MEELTQIAKFLGEDNEKKLKDGITELLLNQAKTDIEDKYEYDYCINFDDIYDEIKEEIKDEVRRKLREKYMEDIDRKVKEMLA